jgi:hypothetical protein
MIPCRAWRRGQTWRRGHSWSRSRGLKSILPGERRSATTSTALHLATLSRSQPDDQSRKASIVRSGNKARLPGDTPGSALTGLGFCCVRPTFGRTDVSTVNAVAVGRCRRAPHDAANAVGRQPFADLGARNKLNCRSASPCRPGCPMGIRAETAPRSGAGHFRRARREPRTTRTGEPIRAIPGPRATPAASTAPRTRGPAR